jgi:hypothetical protein
VIRPLELFREGDVLAGKYRVDRILGAGERSLLLLALDGGALSVFGRGQVPAPANLKGS